MCERSLISIVPAVRKLELVGVGDREELCFEFSPGINVIAEKGPAYGNNTVIRAILHALLPSSRPTCPLFPRNYRGNGRISLELMDPRVSVNLEGVPYVPDRDSVWESMGQFMFMQLKMFLKAIPTGMAVLIEDNVTACLDPVIFKEAVKLLNRAKGQIICIISREIEQGDLPRAKVFVCGKGM